MVVAAIFVASIVAIRLRGGGGADDAEHPRVEDAYGESGYDDDGCYEGEDDDVRAEGDDTYAEDGQGGDDVYAEDGQGGDDVYADGGSGMLDAGAGAAGPIVPAASDTLDDDDGGAAHRPVLFAQSSVDDTVYRAVLQAQSSVDGTDDVYHFARSDLHGPTDTDRGKVFRMSQFYTGGDSEVDDVPAGTARAGHVTRTFERKWVWGSFTYIYIDVLACLHARTTHAPWGVRACR